MSRGKNSMQRAECDSRLYNRGVGGEAHSRHCVSVLRYMVPPEVSTRSPKGMAGRCGVHGSGIFLHSSSNHSRDRYHPVTRQVRRPVSGPPRRRLVTADNCIQSHPTRGSWLHDHSTGMPCKGLHLSLVLQHSLASERAPRQPRPLRFFLILSNTAFSLVVRSSDRANWFRFQAPPASCCVPFKHFFWGLPAPLALFQSLHLIGEWTWS